MEHWLTMWRGSCTVIRWLRYVEYHTRCWNKQRIFYAKLKYISTFVVKLKEIIFKFLSLSVCLYVHDLWVLFAVKKTTPTLTAMTTTTITTHAQSRRPHNRRCLDLNCTCAVGGTVVVVVVVGVGGFKRRGLILSSRTQCISHWAILKFHK